MELKVFEMLKEKYSDKVVELNYIFSRSILDCALFINNIKIDIEYDGWYWHNPKDDRRKDEYLKSKGWKVLRIRSGHKIPTIEQLEIAIKKLTTTDKVFTTITLDDWKEEEYEFSLSRSDRK